jgi:hypothetical protein
LDPFHGFGFTWFYRFKVSGLRFQVSIEEGGAVFVVGQAAIELSPQSLRETGDFSFALHRSYRWLVYG